MAHEASQPERDDPPGGAFGASLAARSGSFVFTRALGGVITMHEGEPQFADTFDEQLRLVGQHIARRLAIFDCTTADTVDATVLLHPSVDIRPGEPLDRLQADVFVGCSPPTCRTSAVVY
jgi:hypothetical protein